MFADLHLHTSFSDGTFSPEELAIRAKAQGLSVISLTDHDTVEGCARAAAACEQAGIEFISGCELTAEWNNDEIHLIGYFIDTAHPELLAEIARFQEVRQNRIQEMVARINKLNVPLRTESVFALANCRSPGRPHVARTLVQEGFCNSLDEAFDRFLKKGRPAWVPKFKISATEAIRLIHAAGGVATLAHPVLNRTDAIIGPLVECGLDALECFHTRHTPSDAERYLGIARQYNLSVTGGSDCHGMNRGKPLIGNVRLPQLYIAQLRERWEAVRDSAFSEAQASAV